MNILNDPGLRARLRPPVDYGKPLVTTIVRFSVDLVTFGLRFPLNPDEDVII